MIESFIARSYLARSYFVMGLLLWRASLVARFSRDRGHIFRSRDWADYASDSKARQQRFASMAPLVSALISCPDFLPQFPNRAENQTSAKLKWPVFEAASRLHNGVSFRSPARRFTAVRFDTA